MGIRLATLLYGLIFKCNNKVKFKGMDDDLLAVCRSDRVRLVQDVRDTEWTDDIVYEVLVNPHATDDLLLEAMEHASVSVLERAARQSSHVANLRAISIPAEPALDMLGKPTMHNTMHNNRAMDKYEFTKRLCKAANGDWLLAERVADWLERP
jgi:hypothetical protein